MNDESLELDLELDENENINNRAESRIKDLSSKVRDTAKERDEAKRLAEEQGQARAAAEKKADFLESFAEISAKYPNAPEYREAIQEKVLNSGYTIEDAAAAVLVAEGKYTPPEPEPQQVESPIGGSAATPNLGGDGKGVAEMSQEERRAQLLEADKRGEVAQILQRGL